MSTQEIEGDLVSAALLEPSLTNITLSGEQFANAQYGIIWEATRSLHQRNIQPDPVGIVTEAKPNRIEHAEVVQLIGRYGVAANVPTYAEQIIARWQREQVDNALGKAHSLLAGETPTDQVVARLLASLNHTGDIESVVEQTYTLDEFCTQPLPPNDWVVDGLISRGDRLILTGGEGSGKSIMMRQLAVCTAAGLHPFTQDQMPPKRVLVIDAENPLRIMVNTYGRLRSEMRRRGLSTEDRLWIHRFPQGLNLDKPQDRLQLHGLVREFRPDLLMIGPAYKLYVGGAGVREEDLARQVTSVLDGLREEFGFALILEHHSPHAAPGVAERSVRPIGSSLWMRWPEFGIGLRLESGYTPEYRSAALIHWRGPRDERPWPERVETSSTLPWVEADPR